MAAVGGVSTLLAIWSLLPSVIGTRAEARECAFSDHLQGASQHNRTVRCSRGYACFGLWEQTGAEVVLLKQGCWTSQPDCVSDLCLVTAPPAHIQKGSYRFCCCSKDLCNRNFREAPVSTEPPVPPVRHYTDGAGPGRRSILVVVGIVAGALTLVSLLFCGYRFLTGKKKLSLVSQNMPETSSSSCVDMDELRLWELIGRGRYSSVYLGSLSECSVAVKVYPSIHRQKYINERYIYSLLSPRQQPNIAHFLCADERVDSEGCTQLLITMDYYPHGCLSHFLSHSSVDWTSCCKMMLGVTRGLSFLHSEVPTGDESKPALAHRNVCSSNILVRSDLSCVLADFSLSMSLTRDPRHLHGNVDSVAISEVGTLRYLAPELLAGALDLHEYGTALKQVDVYALGLLFWESFRRCHHLFPRRAPPHFQLAFELELGQEPTLESMHMLVVRGKERPHLPSEWRDNSPVLRLLRDTMEDCWDQDAEARLSAHCAEERLRQLALLSVPTLHKHSAQSCSSRPDVDTVDQTGSISRDERSSIEDIRQTAAGRAFCLVPPLTGGAVPAVSVCLPLEHPQVLPQRPSSLQLLCSAPSRERQGGPQHSSRPTDRRVETGVAKMNSVPVLAQAPVNVTMATSRRAVLMADGSSAGVPTLVINRLMARGVTNRAGPQENDPGSSRGPVQQSMMDPEQGLHFLWSPDEQQPLLCSEVPPAGALLSVQHSNANNNNSNIQSSHVHHLRAQMASSCARISLSSAPEPTEELSCPPAPPPPSKPHTQVPPECLDSTASVLPHALCPAPGVLSTRRAVCSDGPHSTASPDSCPSRPCSLDLSPSSSSSPINGAPQSDSALSVSGEKIRRRVKTPYTVKKWRPSSWVPPTDHTELLLLQTIPTRPTISQSKSSMAMFVQGGGANSKPDGFTSF